MMKNTPAKSKLNLSLAFLMVALTACGGGSTSSSSSSAVASAAGPGGLTPLVQNDGVGNGGGNSTLLPINLCTPAHQQLLDLSISDIYRLDANNVRLPETAAELSQQQTGTVTVGANTYNISWLKVDLNQLFFPTSPLGSGFTRISYDITKVDPRYQVWSQTQGNAGIRVALLDDVIANSTGYQTIVTLGTAGGLELLNAPNTYARFLDNGTLPFHAVNDPRPQFNWVSTTATRKIVVVQVCDADFEDLTAPVNPTTGYRDLIKGKSQPILVELSEDIAP